MGSVNSRPSSEKKKLLPVVVVVQNSHENFICAWSWLMQICGCYIATSGTVESVRSEKFACKVAKVFIELKATSCCCCLFKLSV